MKKLIKTVAFTAILILLLGCANFVLRNKNEANLVYPYRYEKKNSLDIVFVGSSHVMCGVYPALLESEFGIKSYDFTSSALVLPQSYYQVIEALRTQTPKVLVVDVSGAVYEDTKVGTREYVHVQLDNMPWSLNKVNAINDLIQKEDRAEYYLPLIKFHSRWKELTSNDFKPITGDTRGAYISDGVLELDSAPAIVPRDYTVPMSHTAETYLRKILDYCKKKDVKVVLLNTPTVSTGREQGNYNAVYGIAEEYGVEYYNMMYDLDEMGFDFLTDMRDEYHCNRSGGEKVTRLLAARLQK